jgi:hypothetical protein
MTVFPHGIDVQGSPSSSHPLRRIFPRITEDSQQTHVSSDSTRDGEQPSHSRLKRLMLIQRPVDLSDAVEIPDYRNPAKGGLADVYAGTYNGTRVCFVQLYCSFLYSISPGRRQSIQDKQRPGRSRGSV